LSADAKIPDEVVAAMGAEPTDEQWGAISMPLEPYVLVAGAGSGKTSVMAARVVYLALVALGRVEADHPGALPGNVLCLTFTNKATELLQLRVRRALEHVDLPEGEEPEIANYHGYAVSLLERHGLLAGIEPGQRVLSAAQRVELCARVLDEMTFEHATATWQPSLIANILELDDQAQNHLVTPEEIVAFNEARLELLKKHRSDRAYRAALERLEFAHAATRYRQLKRDLNVMDFGDQIELALRLVERHPEVAADERARFDAVLLDEYQDTNVAQARLLLAVFGGGHPVTAVGDPDQNIYAWRGASLYNLLEFPKQFRRANGEPAAKLPLYTNFRSGARILEAADTLIAPLPAAQRPDPDKRLVPWPDNGEGAVEIVRHQDELSEASGIAERIVAVHDEGARWSDVAVLCRSSGRFAMLQQAFRERDVPVEIVGLAGLLKMPEVVEVLAYARATHDPRASVALARILLGPRYRVGYKDLAIVASLAKKENIRMRDVDEDEGEANPFLFAEALERLDELDGLSDEGLTRLEEFRDELRALRLEARRPVGEFFEEVIRRTGILDELDADLDRQAAQTAKRNLAAFLDEVHAFEPVEGELTLRAFLAYVEEMEGLDKQEWAPVQPSDEDSVKVMTIHQAKGLEFDHVFVPAVARGMLPNTDIPQNPAERGKSLDFELRGDRDILPAFDGVLSHFKDDLKAQELIEERRTAYVALTRARRSLCVSGSYWYGERVTPAGKSLFLDELADWGEGTGHADVDRGPGEPADENPMLGFRERFVRAWPGPAQPKDADGLFPDGWRRAALEAAGSGGVQSTLVEALSAPDRELFESLAAERRHHAGFLLEREEAGRAAGARAPAAPRTVSVGALIDHARCPKRFYWTTVRPLPRFSGPAARIGTDVHRWIERRSSGQATLLELEETPDLTTEELAGEPGRVERLRRAFLESRFADITPLHAERPFLLRLDGFTVSGRIDAVYGRPDGPWEIVDWKTGKRPADDDPLAGLQLDLYGLACVEIWGKLPDELTLTYLYLASAEEASHAMEDPDAVRARVVESLRAIAEGAFEPTPGPQCTYCDFRSFCVEGKAWLSSSAAASSM
jgi:DNA helicase-2/ATP-dependent DNA helicase PcrA